MVGKEILGSAKVVVGLPPASRSSDGSGDTVDTQGYEAVMVSFLVGDVSGTISLTPELLESDSSTTGFTVVAAADLIGGAFTEVTGTSSDNTVQSRAYKGTKRYLRANDNRTGTSAVNTAAVFVLANPRHVPVVQVT